MYKFIQRKKKLLLAVFGVMLMIVFVLPIGMNQMQTDPETLVYGRVGSEKLTRGDVMQARRDIDALMDARFAPLMQLGEAMSFGQSGGRVAMTLRDNPETYALLQQEAKSAGVVPDPLTIGELFEVYFQQPGRTLKPDEAAGYRAAIERFLLVRDHYQRVLGNIKVTRPLVRDGIVRRQQPTLNIVEFAAADFVADAPEPTEAQVVSQYNQYATVTAAPAMSFAATQPLQFGYRQQDRLKLQYLELPAVDMMTAGMKSLKPVDLLPLDSVAFAYYSANPQEFQTTPATQPATDATSQPATATSPATSTAAATATATAPAAPTTRPFADVRPELRRRVLMNEVSASNAQAEDVVAAQMLRQKVEARAAELRNALRDRLLKDYKDAAAAKQMAGIEKVDYLETVANEFEKANGVRPVVKSLASDFLTLKDLAALPGIGQSTADAVAFPQLATRHREEVGPEGPEAPKTQPSAGTATQPATAPAATTAPATTSPATTAPVATTIPAATAPSTQPAVTVEPTKPAKPTLALLEPSPLLLDPAGNACVFRLTAFEGEHVPTLEEARPMIVKDLKLVAAYELAKKEAVKVRDAAGSPAGNSAIGGLPIISPSAVKVVGPIALDNRRPEIPGYDLTDPTVQQALLPALFRLLGQAKADLPHPSTVVDMPSKQKALAIELRSYERPWTSEEDARMQMQQVSGARTDLMREQAVQDALQSWFNPESVAGRTNFKKEE